MPRRRGAAEPRRSSQSAAVLLVTLGILALMAVFALAFAGLVRLEKQASTNYVDAQRAKLAARAGLWRAIDEIRNIAGVQSFDDVRDNQPQGRWYFRDVPGTPAEVATSPSFRNTGMARVMEDSSTRQFSGSLGGTYTQNALGDLFVLKIYDCASMINVNNPNRQNTRRMITNLCQAMSPAIPNATEIGQAVIDRAPPGGYGTKQEIEEAIRAGVPSISEANLRRLRDLITAEGYFDDKVIRPPNGSASLVLEARAPVNVNTAAREVLTAVMADLAGRDRSGASITISLASAQQLAQAIFDRTHSATGGGPFKNWKEFNDFLDGTSAGGLNAQQKAVVKANANPNTDLNKFFPDPNLDLPVDKTDLTTYSTEFCFSSMGFFEITSVGSILQIVGRSGSNDLHRVVAESRINAIVKVFSVYRDTTQRDFENGRQINLASGVARDSRGYVWLGVPSVPEYPNDRDPANGSMRSIYVPADYDGQLRLNNLVRVRVQQNTSTGRLEDLMIGFARGAQDPQVAPNPSASRPNPIADVALNDRNPSNSGGTQPRHVNPNGVFSLVTRGEGVAAEDLFRGSDLFPDGILIQMANLGSGAGAIPARNRFLQFGEANMYESQTSMLLDHGTVEFWVKPLRDAADLPGRREVYFQWGAPPNSSVNGIQVSRTRLVSGQQRIVAYFSNASGATKEVFSNINWNRNEWHHVRVCYGKYNNGGTGVADGQLWVDGAPGSGPISFRIQQLLLGPRLQTFVPTSFDDVHPDGSIQENPPYPESIIKPNPPGNGPVFIGRDDAGSSPACAVFDNVFVHHYRDDFNNPGSPGIHAPQLEMPVKVDRYFDQSLQSYGTLFRKRVALFTGSDLRLGTISWTAYPAYAPNEGQVQVNLEVGLAGSPTVLTPSAADVANQTMALNGRAVTETDQVFYTISITASTRSPFSQSPILDDVTITYFTNPQVVYLAEGGE